MGKRGPQKGTSYLPPSEIRRRGKRSLREMYPTALSVLSKALNAEDNKPEGQSRATEDAWGIVHMRDGRPKQQVDTHLTGQLTLTEQLRGLSEAELVALRAMLAGAEGDAG